MIWSKESKGIPWQKTRKLNPSGKQKGKLALPWLEILLRGNLESGRGDRPQMEGATPNTVHSQNAEGKLSWEQAQEKSTCQERKKPKGSLTGTAVF